MKVLTNFLIFLLILFFSAAQAYTVFEENGRVGLKNDQGKILIPAEYEALGWANGSFSIVNNVVGYYENSKWGLISLENRRITKAEFEGLVPGEFSLIIARQKSKLSLRIVAGCINAAGKEVIPFLYDGLRFSAMRIIVYTKIGNLFKYGLIDLENKALIPQQYQDIRSMGTLRFAVRNFEGQTAIFTDGGKQITGFTIDSLSTFKKNYAILYQGVQRGLINRDGEIKVQPIYRDIHLQDNGSVKVREADEWIFLNGQNKMIRSVKADSISVLGHKLLRMEMSGVNYLMNDALMPVTKTTFTTVGKFENGKALYTLGKFYGLVLTDGKILLPPLYKGIIPGREYILVNQPVSGRDSWTLLDSAAVMKIDKHYEDIKPFNGKFFAVRNRGYWGAISKTGEPVMACAYDSLLQVKDNRVVVKFHGQYGVVNLQEEWIVTPQKNKIRLIGHDRYLEFSPTTTFLKPLNGNVIYFSNNTLAEHENYLLEYQSSGIIWRIDLNGVIVDREVSQEEFKEEVFGEAEGYRAIKKNGKYGFVDSQNRLRIANRYEAVKKFSEGMAPAKILGKWGYINRYDNIAVQPVYEEVFPYKNGFAVVKQKGSYGLINKTGKIILPVRYELIKVLPSGNFLIIQDQLSGLADVTGRVVINPKYNGIKDVSGEYVIVERQGKYGVINLRGVSTIPLIYDYIDYDAFHKTFLAVKRAEWKEIVL